VNDVNLFVQGFIWRTMILIFPAKLPLLKNDIQEHSYGAKMLYYKSYAILYRETGNLRKSLRFCKKWVELNESQPEQINENPILYIDALDNLLHCLCHPKNQDSCLTNLKKLKSIPENFPKAKTKSVEAAIYVRYYYHLLNLHTRSGDFSKSIAMVPEIQTWLKYSKTKTNQHYSLILYLFITTAYLALKKHAQALIWSDKTLKDKYVKEWKDVYAISRVLNLIICYETESDNIDRQEQLLRSAYHSLNNRKLSYAFEPIILKFIKTQHFNKSPTKHLIKDVKEVQNQFNELMKDPYESKILEYFDFTSWMDSQIKGIAMQKVIQKKLKSGR